MDTAFRLAPEWQVDVWLNRAQPLSLAQLRGRVVLLHAFQMLCPGCVNHGLPQAQRVHTTFPPDDVAVVGLHTVFEHHEAMTETALRAFVREYRLSFAIGIDRPVATQTVPATMAAYRMQGTPTTVLIDRDGRLRAHYFGAVDDLRLGAELMSLIKAPTSEPAPCSATVCLAS